MDSEVTFEEDPDEEIDKIKIEEEDWIEYMKRSIVDAVDKMERAKIRCWNRTHKKNEMDIGTENCNFTVWKMADKGCWMEPWAEFKI